MTGPYIVGAGFLPNNPTHTARPIRPTSRARSEVGAHGHHEGAKAGRPRSVPFPRCEQGAVDRRVSERRQSALRPTVKSLVLRPRRVSWDELKNRLAEANWKEALRFFLFFNVFVE